MALIYVIHCMQTNCKKRYSEAYKRKRLRLLELQNSNLKPFSREEWELTQDLIRLTWPR